MSRIKTEATVWIENLLSSQPEIRFNSVVTHPEYQANGFRFDNTYFNAVKARFKKTNNYSSSFASAVSNIASRLATNETAVVSGGEEYKYDSETMDMIPNADPYYVLCEENVKFYDMVNKMSRIRNVNIRMSGPAGCGKTSLAAQYAAKHGLPMFLVNCGNVREPRDWFGYRDLDKDKNLIWHESLFVKMIETPNAVIILDETNRCPASTLNTLYPILDNRRQTYLEEAGRNLTVAEGVTFWCCHNDGNQFTGTTQMDEAFSDRTSLVNECKFLSIPDESNMLHSRTGLSQDICLKLAEVADQVRKKSLMDISESFSKPISTRMLEEAAFAFAVAGPETMKYTLLQHFSSAGGQASERANLQKLLTGKFGQI